MKLINFGDTALILICTQYEHDKSLAVFAETLNHEPYVTLTVNLNFPVLKNEQFFDINLFRGPELLKLLIEKKLVEKTGFELKSGFVNYPMVRWNIEENENE